MPNTFNVFVIGPMGADKDSVGESGTPISQHMTNIAAALRTIMPTYVTPPKRWEVFSPHEGATDIAEYVFTHIDDAELAVADITTRSPSVMYELSFFHSLGTPVIIIDDGSIPDALPFYLKGANILRVVDFSVEKLVPALNERLQKFFNPDNIQDFSINPIKTFYGAPLMEISGAATIARGYYTNFIARIIDKYSGLAANYDDGPIKKLFIVRPSGDLDDSSDMDLFMRSMPNKMQHKFEVRGVKEFRPLSAYYDGRAIFDLPRTVYTLSHSPRLQRLKRAMDEIVGANELRKKEMVQRGLEGLVERFYTTIRSRVAEDENANKKLLEIISIEEIEAHVYKT